MRVCVTGAGGYIGSTLIEYLINDPDITSVVAYDNLMYRQTSLLRYCYHPKFEFVYADVRNHKKLKEEVGKADILIPLAALVGMPACDKDQQLATQVNYEHVKIVAENSQGKILVTPNTNSGYGASPDGKPLDETAPLNPLSHYGRTKCDAEKAVLDAGGVSLRLATVFGISPRQRLDLLVNDFTYKALTDGYIVLFEKHFRRNYIHVRDVCVAFMFMIKHYEKAKNNVYNVGLSSANLTKLELAEKIKEYVPRFSIQCDNYTSDWDKRDYLIDNSKIENLGWRPQYSLDDGIKELIKGYKMLFLAQQVFTNL